MTKKKNEKLQNSMRLEVWQILTKVFTNHGQSHVLLNRWVQNHKTLTDRDKNFVFQLVHGTLTWQPYLDFLTRQLVHPQRTPLSVQVLLWMSLYQFYFMDRVPNYAVVNEAVEIAKDQFPPYAKLVNGSLQNALRREGFHSLETLAKEKPTSCYFALKYAFPQILYTKLKNDFGQEIAEKIMADSLNKPRYSFRLNTLKCPSQDIFSNLGLNPEEVYQGLTDESFWTTNPKAIQTLLNQGFLTIQDQASILVAKTLLADNLSSDLKIWDMCAAPGGKLTHLAALMKNQGLILATEINPQKIPFIEKNLKRLGVKNVQLKQQDALCEPPLANFDAILLDAPCSGLGVLKRKPEIKLNFDFKTLSDLTNTQAQLLDQAAKHLKSGGQLVYSTCTLNPDENQKQIAHFLQKHQDWKLLKEEQIFGFENKTDGFYIAKLQKK
ncbi:16S rRNA (cytosine967-C5)-methyltransferase [Entomoplasma freundtii]|uniref:16S rRNA (cytosine(967)-C(5))-methyltransferase n=1 Tax=Entomoplasma freundtii TaxID=74700 RepID=A0A2K8NSX5_9MOLU|nr:16S rRNA (cytosine(967)-C(5))-methyltransferase RsmB [Entomoplasma freundtii]ATZ16268.1 16S rRNA (cytosine(967)-C(5))-methyltransferase [Entomoplasma freundtii]TDY56831.1 16S rRNA (cytosine967-C5)-methyltransferase [Entomoplasma freundtii]